MKDILTGNLLITSSLVTDPIYAGGVCLVVHQDESHVIGVMLNRPMKPSPEAMAALMSEPKTIDKQDVKGRMIHDSKSELDDWNSFSDGLTPTPLGLLHFGGPLSGPLVAIHQSSQFAEAETGNGIFVAAQKQHLEDLVRQKSGPIRLIVGHLGWELGQLEAEIQAGIWHPIPATAEAIFGSAGAMWPNLIRRATSRSMARWIGVKDLVDAAELN